MRSSVLPLPLPLALASTILRPALVASTMLALLGGTALAQSAPPVPVLTITPTHRTTPAAVAAETTPVLKRLPAGRSELTFRGENAARTWSVMLGRSEAARTATFQLSLLNAISVLPDRSALKITINGTVLATIPADATDKPASLAIKIPTGVLVPGANVVQISAALAHRVDCSVKATYELWASLDPLTTGFLVPREVAAGASSLDDLGVEPLAEDGTTRIHVRMDDGAAAEDIGHAGRFVDALARRAGLPRPVVDVGPDLGKGAGFDVVIDKGNATDAAKSLKIVANGEGVSIGRDAASNRLVLVLAGADDATIDRTIAALARNRQARGDAPLAGSVSRSFADFGFSTDNFTGRHYMSSLDVNLPADFYPANDRARLLLDGGHSAALVEGSTLVFRVNGTLISSLPLRSGVAERFEHEVVELPLRFFHPGHNDISIEGMTSAAADQQCDLATMPHDARLTIANTSRFDMPGFAHLATLPQIQTALAYDSGPDGGPIQLYLADADRDSMGAGLTFLANMAATQERIGTPMVHLGDPALDDAPGLVIAPADRLPQALSTALANLSAPVDANVKTTSGAAAQDPVGAAAPSDVFIAAAAGGEQTASLKVNTVVAAAETMLRSHGFFFATDSRADLLPATHSSMLIAAVAPDTASTVIGGVELPRFLRDPAHWLVVTAPDAATTEAGIRRLVANGQWAQLGGRAVSLDLGTDELRTIQPNRFAYVWPNSVVLSDVRPIFGGVVSHNIVLSIGILMLLMSILGVSTHVLVRRMGCEVRLAKLVLSGALMSAVLPITGFPVQNAARNPAAVVRPASPPAAVTTDTLVGGVAAAWLKSEWLSYTERFVTSDGRVVDNANGGVSHSEGQGYGLLLASMARDADRFQTLWTWTRSHLMVRSDGLAAWKWDPKAGAVTDVNNATDGDILIAWALWNAANRFDRADYREAARAIARAIGAELVVSTRQGPILLPGALGFGAADRHDGPVVNPSYWVFPAFAALRDLAPETDWEGVRRTGMAILDRGRFGPYGLPVEWESLAGTKPVPAEGFPAEFGYNAVRIPLYLALEGSETSRRALHRFAGRWPLDGSATHLVDLKAAAISPPIGAPGYNLIFALARCAMDGQAIPPEMINARSDLYYPETLRLLSVVAIQERFPSCL